MSGRQQQQQQQQPPPTMNDPDPDPDPAQQQQQPSGRTTVQKMNASSFDEEEVVERSSSPLSPDDAQHPAGLDIPQMDGGGGAAVEVAIGIGGDHNSDDSNDDYDDEATSSGCSDGRVQLQCLTGMRHDLKARLPYYRDDWGRPRSIATVVNATVFAFVAQLIPNLIFAELMSRVTYGNLSVPETLLSSGIIGVMYAVLAGQPLVLLGITGPVAILLGTFYRLTITFDAAYFPFFFWTCMWAGFLHVVSAMVGLVSLVWKVTPFTTQVFELFTAVTFIYNALRDLLGPLRVAQPDDDTPIDKASHYVTLVIGAITCWIAWTCHFADTWVYFTPAVRTILSSYNTLAAIVIGTALSYLPGVDNIDNEPGSVPRVNLSYPWNWQPTQDRPWVVSPVSNIGAAGILGAFVPGLMFYLLFIIDHNVSAILTQSPKYNLKKPPAYHWDFFVLGLTFVPCAILGLPPGCGLLPQAPLHSRALSTREQVIDPTTGQKREIVTHVEEQRWSALFQALLMFVALASFRIMSWIPKGCLYGLLLYLGLGALHGCEVWERFLLSFIVPSKRPSIRIVRHVAWYKVQLWTFLQVCCAVTIVAVAEFASFGTFLYEWRRCCCRRRRKCFERSWSLTASLRCAGYLYPVLLAVLVPLRSYVLERLVSKSDLRHLDPQGESEDDYADEQRAIQRAQLNVDGEEAIIPSRNAFRGKGVSDDVVKRRNSPSGGLATSSLRAPDQVMVCDIRASSRSI